MDETRVLAAAYFSQQKELGMPDLVFSSPFDLSVLSASLDNMPRPSSVKTDAPLKTAPRLVPFSQLKLAASSAADPVRDALVALYNKTKTCGSCGLAASRTTYVFGSGNPHASLMVVGEAPGEEEDRQGLPFVGRAGELLTRMLAAINLDRKKDVFIANVLKCRPPQNRNPESSEILACRNILDSQIDIIKPKALLLLGRIAAHSLLDTTKSIAALRGETHQYNGIAAFVTYHPASILRNEGYRRPAWEDMQKLQKTLMEPGTYGNTTAG